MACPPRASPKPAKDESKKIQRVEVWKRRLRPPMSARPVRLEKDGASEAPRESVGMLTPVARREAMVKRVYRVVMEEVDAIREDANDREIAKVLAEQSSTVTGNAA